MVETINAINTAENKKVNKKRIDYIDIYRAFGIILMIMGHIGFGKRFDYFIHAFHMPMFFIVSGFFFKSGVNFKEFTVKKVKSLLLPYFVFGILFYFIWVALNWQEKSLQPLINLFSVNTDGLPIAGALWFLTSLFFTELLFFLIDKIKFKWIKYIIIILISLLGNVAVQIIPFRLPFALDAAFVGVGLFGIGYLFKLFKESKIVNKLFNLKFYVILPLIIINIYLIFTNDYINMRCGLYGNIPLFWINAFLAFIIGINICKKLDSFLNTKIKNFITEIGKNSIIYLCFNQIVILVINIFTKNIVIENDTQKYLVNSLIMVISLILLKVLSLIMVKTKLRVLVGK
ncbi:MAG: acyltransferase family protein [Clostridia bacterium]|nr:acyltransferase family protein [Clostridia bacterium]